MSLCGELARRVDAFGTKDLDDAALAAAKRALIDTVGVTLLGSVEESARIARGLPGSCEAPGLATVYGTDIRTSALDAALVNGVAAHALDFDDFTEEFGGHPSVPLLPALLAQGETADVTWLELAAAYVAGVELETRLAHAVHMHHYEKGWHPTATLGVFGAAAACAHLMKLEVEQTATALAIAASFACGVKGNFGTMTKPLHVGHCARSGLYAALLAQRGFTANPDVLEHEQGFLTVYNGAGNYVVDKLMVPWFEPPVLLWPGLSIKQFACCGSTHPSIFMALALREKHQVEVQAIERITIATHPFRLPHTDKPFPRTSLEAKFSIQYTVALALTKGKVLLADFEDDALRQPEIQRLLKVTHAGVDPDMAKRDERCFGAEVTVQLRSGQVLRERTENMPGRGPANPMSEQELQDKFFDCAQRALPGAQTRMLWKQLVSLRPQDAVADLCASARADVRAPSAEVAAN